MMKIPNTKQIAKMFSKLWPVVTDDNPLTLYGFRRFRTIHLLNLRFLEEEIDIIDSKIYQAGFKLGLPLSENDRLGLRYGKRDKDAPRAEDCIDETLVLKLRGLIKQYDDALASFNHVMMMETFALADNDWQSRIRENSNPYEAYKTRMLRLDMIPNRRAKGFLEHALRRYFRDIWFFFRSQNTKPRINDAETQSLSPEVQQRIKASYQNTSFIAECVSRLIIALIAGLFLVGPLVILSYQSQKEAHLITISICITVFSCLMSVMSSASHQEILAASAAYAAVLVVFISNGN